MNTLAASITDLFLAFGNVSEDRVRAFSRMLTNDNRCHVCLEAVCRKAATTANRMPSVASIIAAYHDQYDIDHAHHLGISDIEASVGRDEAWWRTDGVRIIEPYVGEREIASFIAAQMWWCRITRADVAHVIENPMWANCARTFLASHPDVHEAAWTRARAAASTDDERSLPMAIVNLGGPT